MPYADIVQHAFPWAAQSEASRAAAIAAVRFVGQQGLDVLAWFVLRGERGGTQKEAHEALDIERPSMCARVNALEKQGRLRKTSERRGGCAVYRV